MRNILIIAGKEIQEGLRNRWVLATTLLLADQTLPQHQVSACRGLTRLHQAFVAHESRDAEFALR